jgi:anhydro-N-acetylmuramic acid kinase
MLTETRVIGLMSGTSLDGLDICSVVFSKMEGKFFYRLENAETIQYPYTWLVRLKTAENCTGAELMRLHSEYGTYLGNEVSQFIQRHSLETVAFVSSHGHTIFHRPDQQYTFQLGSGASLAAAAKLPVVCDFRMGDVARKGQGAPLVPIGDQFLFSEYTACLNLGGFANISFDQEGKRLAGDICPVNYVLNRLAQRAGKKYDSDGKLAAAGKMIPELFDLLNHLSFYKKAMPKSLGREWVESTIFPMFKSTYSTEDLLHTCTHHAAMQIAAVTPSHGEMLVTGGGAHNSYLLSLLREQCKVQVVVPERQIVDFKEALIFAMLGWLRWNNQVNALASVTGAESDSVCGAIYY